jgi:chorismate dehydratase
MVETIHVGAWNSFALLPLLEGLGKGDGIALEMNLPAHTAFHLRDRLTTIAFLSPIDFAKDSSGLRVVPDIGLWSNGGSGSVTVHFQTGVQDIETLAVDPAYAAEAILAKIIFAEEFDASPQIVPVSGSIEQMLANADAALLVGDTALRESAFHPNALDLTESWVQMTDLPFVHGLWCARHEDLSTEIVDMLRNGRHADEATLASIAARAAHEKRFPGLSSELLKEHLEGFFYTLPEDALDGMREFLRFAYYHGVLPDIPEIHIYSGPEESEDDDPIADRQN